MCTAIFFFFFYKLSTPKNKRLRTSCSCRGISRWAVQFDHVANTYFVVFKAVITALRYKYNLF